MPVLCENNFPTSLCDPAILRTTCLERIRRGCQSTVAIGLGEMEKPKLAAAQTLRCLALRSIGLTTGALLNHVASLPPHDPQTVFTPALWRVSPPGCGLL